MRIPIVRGWLRLIQHWTIKVVGYLLPRLLLSDYPPSEIRKCEITPFKTFSPDVNPIVNEENSGGLC